MSNIFEKIGHGLKIAAVDTEHAVVDIVTFLPHLENVIADAIENEPEVKQAVINLAKNASTVFADGAVAVAGKGIDLVSDARVLADAEAFFVYFRDEFVPLVEKLYADVQADLSK